MIVIEKHIVGSVGNHTRIYDYLPGKLEVITTRKGIKKALQKGRILLNNEKANSALFVKQGDTILLLESTQSRNRTYEKIIDVIYEDDYIAIVIKPAGIVVSGNRFKTLENMLPYNLKSSSQKDQLPWPLPTHRLDEATSGLVIIAKTYSSRVKLGEMFEKSEISKEYRALVQGEMIGSGEINSPIYNKASVTKYAVIKNVPNKRNKALSLVSLSPVTGRKHQLRIHLSELGFPILGDKLYGEKGNTLLHKGLFLAATKLKFNHPITAEELVFEIEMPNKFLKFLK